jgi:Tol biopolymer transport system component
MVFTQLVPLLVSLLAPAWAAEPGLTLAQLQPAPAAVDWIPAPEDLLTRPGPRPCEAEPCVWAQRDDIWLRADGQERRLTQGEDRFYDPVLSPDGRRVAFSGLITGLHVMELDSGELAHLGPGRWPAWHPRGALLVFERNSDDGHGLTSAELMLWWRGLDRPRVLIAGPDTLDRAPTFSPDGRQLAWLRDGEVWVARVTEVAP